MINLVALVAAAIMLSQCATSGDSSKRQEVKAPVIERDMPLDDALKAAIDFGGETARDVRKLIVRRKQWPLAEKALYQAIQDGIIKYENTQLTNAVRLYISGPVKPQEALFTQLVSSGRPLARQLGWQMAGALPGKVMRTAIDRELNRALQDDDEDVVLIPEMAVAVRANGMTTAYSLVRRGLMTKNSEEFAAAMAALSPEQASRDFLEYMALCPPEELRQMNISSIDMFAATTVLNHMIKYPPNASEAGIEVLFSFAISRNTVFSDLAMTLIEKLSQKSSTTLALSLARMPVWTQVAFIEGVRRNMTGSKRIFLGELRKMTAEAEVVDELDDIKL
jgi:hypothetical protein